MKEPKVQVGILFEPQIKFILLTPYHINGEEAVSYTHLTLPTNSRV